MTHGGSGWNWRQRRCDCDTCHRAHQRHTKKHRFNAKRGIRVRIPYDEGPFEMVRILFEDRHWSREEIGAAAFTTARSITRIYYREGKAVYPETYAALKRIVDSGERKEPHSPRGRVTAKLAMLAVRGLYAQGWTFHEIADMIGTTHQAVNPLANGKRTHVNRATRDKILRVAREVGSAQGSSVWANRARTDAARRGWRPTMYVDDLV